MAADPPERRVLVVEDDRMLLAVLQRRLTSSGFASVVCADGQQAIDTLRRQPFDIVLLDLTLPVRDGFAVLTEKKGTINKETPTFVISNLGGQDAIDRAKASGALRVYAKASTSLSSLIQDITQVLSTKE